jgi:hypothetical protein
MERAFPILVAILLVRLVASQARYQRARRLGNTFYFPPGIGLRLIMGLGGPFALYVAYEPMEWRIRELHSWTQGDPHHR